MKILNLETTREVFRQAVLEALDNAARGTFDPPTNTAGATDADLPRLFKAIDVQIEVLAERYGAALVEPGAVGGLRLPGRVLAL